MNSQQMSHHNGQGARAPGMYLQRQGVAGVEEVYGTTDFSQDIGPPAGDAADSSPGDGTFPLISDDNYAVTAGADANVTKAVDREDGIVIDPSTGGMVDFLVRPPQWGPFPDVDLTLADAYGGAYDASGTNEDTYAACTAECDSAFMLSQPGDDTMAPPAVPETNGPPANMSGPTPEGAAARVVSNPHTDFLRGDASKIHQRYKKWQKKN